MNRNDIGLQKLIRFSGDSFEGLYLKKYAVNFIYEGNECHLPVCQITSEITEQTACHLAPQYESTH